MERGKYSNCFRLIFQIFVHIIPTPIISLTDWLLFLSLSGHINEAYLVKWFVLIHAQSCSLIQVRIGGAVVSGSRLVGHPGACQLTSTITPSPSTPFTGKGNHVEGSTDMWCVEGGETGTSLDKGGRIWHSTSGVRGSWVSPDNSSLTTAHSQQLLQTSTTTCFRRWFLFAFLLEL